MPPTERRLVVEAALLLCVARAGLAWMPLASLRGWLVWFARTSGARDSKVRRQQIVRALATAGQRTPFRATCLIEALAAEAMLRRRGDDARFRLGVVRPSDNGLAAHAWVELDGEVIVGGLDTLASYAVLRPSGTS
jgi:hypothetical protein